MVYASKRLRVDVTHIRRERVYEWNCPDGMSERQEGYRYYEETMFEQEYVVEWYRDEQGTE